MGGFYDNITVRGPSPEELQQFLQDTNCDALISPEVEGHVVVYHAEPDGDPGILETITEQLSRQFKCPALGVLNHDDDILMYTLFVNGELLDQYNSDPNYFEDAGEPDGPLGGDAKALCAACDRPEAADRVAEILQKTRGEDGYVFEMDRHHDLAKLLGMRNFPIAVEYGSIDEDELPEGVSMDDLLRAGNQPTTTNHLT